MSEPPRSGSSGSAPSVRAQEDGLLGRLVGGMIRRSVRKRFHTVYWRPPEFELKPPLIFVPNHHGWFDGYLMFIVATRLGIPIIDWIQEYDTFPLFGKIGGMPFPADDAAMRTSTIRRTLRLMRKEGRSLLLFAEGKLHYPPEVLPLERSLDFVSEQVPGVKTVPVAIVYEHSLHELPEAFLAFGNPIDQGPNEVLFGSASMSKKTQSALVALLGKTRSDVREDRGRFTVLAHGTKDINERLSMKWFKK